MKTFQEFILECELVEGKVEWDNPKRPLQSGLTPREKNRAKRISTGVENPDNLPSEKDLERYGKLKIVHDDEKGKKVPRGKRHEFGLFKVGPFTSVAPKGELKRQERKKNNELKDLKEPKEGFEYELEESSTGERAPRGRATLARGRGADMTRKERSTAAIAKRAGFRGTGRFSTKDLRAKTKEYSTDDSYGVGTRGSTKQDTIITTHSSPRQFAEREGIINKSKSRVTSTKSRFTSSGFKTEIKPSSDSVRRAKDFRKSLTKAGANLRGRVHNVEIMPRDLEINKGDPKKRIERGKNFIQAIKDTSKHLKKAGAKKYVPNYLKKPGAKKDNARAKKGEAVIFEPAATMYGEKKDVGARKRAKLYLKLFGKRISKVSPHTKKMVGKV